MAQNPTAPSFASQRLYSLDALRGFDMFWIMGAEEIVHGMAKVTGNSFWEGFSNQLTHPDWNGFHLYDLIFPLYSWSGDTIFSRERIRCRRNKTKNIIAGDQKRLDLSGVGCYL